MASLGAASVYWKDRDVTQKSKDPAVVPELAWNMIVGVLGAPISAAPVVGAQQVVLKLLQGMVCVAVVITAQQVVVPTVTCTRIPALVGRLVSSECATGTTPRAPLPGSRLGSVRSSIGVTAADRLVVVLLTVHLRRTHDVRVILWRIPEVKGRRRIRNWLDLHGRGGHARCSDTARKEQL
jgi:hypothetical protein